MATSLRPFSSHVFEQLHQHLLKALTERCPDHYEDALTLDTIEPPDSDESRALFRVEGPGDVSFEAELELIPTGETTCDVRAETEGGHSRHFRCEGPKDGAHQQTVGRVARRMATFLLNEIEERRTQASSETPARSDLPSPVPLLLLDENGTIQDLTNGARRVLGYSPETSVEPSFFSHVHGQNLRRIMQDLARMVSHGKQRAQWLVRLRTGNHRWRWYRAAAKNHLDSAEGAIRVLLRPLSDR